MPDNSLPPGLYRKPSGDVAAYPTIRVLADPSLSDGERREAEDALYVSPRDYERMRVEVCETEKGEEVGGRVHVRANPLDPEVSSLVDALNAIPTVRTTESCCGHGTEPLRVFFEVEDMAWLYVVGRAIDRNYGGYGFRCELTTTDLPERPVGFVLVTDTDDPLRGPPLLGQAAYEAADALAGRIRDLLTRDGVLRHFNLRA